MPTPPESRKDEVSNTYFVQDRRMKEELIRITIQDQLLTSSMGGALPEQSDLRTFRQVLDVGCATGGWAIEAAKTIPTMSLVGIDIHAKMLQAARERARAEQVDKRVEFLVMDALRLLTFPPASFDLVNMRLAVSFVRIWDWPELLSRFQHVTRRGGIIRLTEADIAEGNSAALTRLNDLMRQAFSSAGNFFTPQNDGLTSQLLLLLTRAGLGEVQTREHVLTFRAGTPAGQHFAEDMQYLYRTVHPFLQKWTRLPDDYDALYQQALIEMQQPGFVGTWRYVTAWGRVVLGGEASALDKP